MRTEWELYRGCRQIGGPVRREPLRVAVLCSSRAPALSYLLRCDFNRGTLYDIVACVSSEATFAEQDAARARGIPVYRYPLRFYCESRGWRFNDPVARSTYDAQTMEVFRHHRVDLVVLDAYLYVLSSAMLSRYPHHVINLHHSDLTVVGAYGRPRLRGLRAVRDAIVAGYRETRATAHLVTEAVDEGPAFLRSWAFPVAPLAEAALCWDAKDIVKAYSYAHQEWMIRATWGPMMSTALALIAEGRVNLRRLTRGARDAEQIFDLNEDGTLRLFHHEHAETAEKGTVPISAGSAYAELASEARL